MKSYSDLLRDPRWQRRRLEILERDEWKCTNCEDQESTLHVHHRRYERGRDPWDYPDEDLLTLCESCHAESTKLDSEFRRIASMLDDCEKYQVLGYMIGLLMRWGSESLPDDATISIEICSGETLDGVAEGMALNLAPWQTDFVLEDPKSRPTRFDLRHLEGLRRYLDQKRWIDTPLATMAMAQLAAGVDR